MMLSFSPGRPITDSEFRDKLAEALTGVNVRGKRVLTIIPDNTRTLPMPAAFETIAEVYAPHAETLSFLIALGTHPPLTETELACHLGPRHRDFSSGVEVLQHQWDGPAALVQVGTIAQEEVAEISGGLLREEVPVRVHRAALEHDFLLLLGPVFPHEVVGFSGGHKYFFPGISGPEILHASHWLGALITNLKVNGHRDTPVRELIEQAAALVPTPRIGISLVMQGHDPVGLFVGEVREAWAAAAELSAEVNIVWADRAYSTVLSMAPPMYRELWTAGKCMYKLEPVVEDGGTLVIYAPHVTEVSATHGKWILEVGYHTRDYFLAQWEQYKHVPWGVLAHSTHVKGAGTYWRGIERPRIEVVLATAIPASVCRQINLGHRDPRSIQPEAFIGREEEGILAVPNAGEMLWRLKSQRPACVGPGRL